MPDDTPKSGFPDLPPLPEPDAEWDERFGGRVLDSPPFIPAPRKRSGPDTGTVERNGRNVKRDDAESRDAPAATPPLRKNLVRPRSNLPSGAAVEQAGEREETQKPDRNGRGRGKARSGLEPPTRCPKCGEPLGTELQLEAFKILREIGRTLKRKGKKNRRAALEEMWDKVSDGLAVLVASRVISFEAATKYLVSTFTVLGKPTLPSLTDSEQSPLDQLSDWMNSTNEDGSFSPLEGKGEN